MNIPEKDDLCVYCGTNKPRVESLEKMAKSIKVIDKLHPLGDCIYDVREREHKGWDGPNVKAYAEAIDELENSLAELDETT